MRGLLKRVDRQLERPHVFDRSLDVSPQPIEPAQSVRRDERFAVGGDDYGRAYEVAVLTGDRGVGGLVELAVKPFLKSKRFGGTELYGFIDGAKIRILDRPLPGGLLLPGGSRDLASAGGGVRLAYTSKAALFLEAAKPLDRPFASYAKDSWRLSVGWRLSLRS